MTNEVTISLSQYETLFLENIKLKEENERLQKGYDKDKVRTIKYFIKTERCIDGMNEVIVRTKFENFEDAKQNFYEKFQKKMDKLKKELEDEKCQKVREALRVRSLEADLRTEKGASNELRQELEKLKEQKERQSLWKRIKSKLKH